MNVEEIIQTSKALPVERKTIIHVQLIANKVNECLSQALKPHGVSLQQFNVLRILRGRNGEPANLSSLNKRMVTKMSNTTRLVDKLIAKGYVKRNICEHNRRKVEIFITPMGLESLKAMDEAIKNAENAIINGFDQKELYQLNLLLDKF